MKFFKSISITLGLSLIMFSTICNAAPNMNTIYVQGYLRKANGTAVSDGSYAVVFSIRSGATYFWTKTISVTVSSGFFSQALSGASSAPYAGTIDSSSLASAATGALVVNVQATIDAQSVSFDVQASPVPLALLSDKTNSVVSGGVDTAALATGAVTSAKIATATIQDTNLSATGTMPAWNGSALTNLPAANITGTLPALSGANLTNLPAANITGTLPAISGTNLTNLPAANLTGTLPAISGASLTNLDASNISSGTLSSARLPATITASGAFTIQSATGVATVVGNTGGAASARIQAGTGKIVIQSNSVTGVAFSAIGACTISSFSCTAGANTARTCTGVPSTAASISCSPTSGAGTNNPTWGVFATGANTVTINSSAACTVASAWNCKWIVP